MPKLNDLICLADAAKLLGLHRQMAFLLVKSGELPAVRVGRAWITTRQAVASLDRRRKATGNCSGNAGGKHHSLKIY
jgi:excisionase family DNA binding protein